MADSEQKILATNGKFIHHLIKGEIRRNNATWTHGHIILTNKNIYLIDNNNKNKITLKSLEKLGKKYDISQAIVKAPDYISLSYKQNNTKMVSLITFENSKHTKELRFQILQTLLHKKPVYIKHPVAIGGVIQNTDWQKAQLGLIHNDARLVTENGDIINIYTKKLQNIEQKTAQLKNKTRNILSIEHENQNNIITTTYIHAPDAILTALHFFTSQDFKKETRAQIDLTENEKQVLMALYTGLSPFDIPTFLNLDIDQVEDIYEKLIRLKMLKEERKRTEVTLTTKGRNLATKTAENQ